MQAKEADKNEASIKSGYARSYQRSKRAMSWIPGKSTKSVRDIIVDVPRSRTCGHVSEEGIRSLHENDDADAEEASITSKPPIAAAVLVHDEIEVRYVPKAATKQLPTPPSSTATVDSASMTESGSFDSGSATLTLPQRYALSIARSPIKHLSVSFAIVTVFSLIGMRLGDVQLEFLGGWFTKGTTISKRGTQEWLIRGLGQTSSDGNNDLDTYCNGAWYERSDRDVLHPEKLRLVSMWKTLDSEDDQTTLHSRSALDADALYEICVAEQHTLKILSENDLCYKCPINSTYSQLSDETQWNCVQPYSLVAVARLYLQFIETGSLDLESTSTREYLNPSISCSSLKKMWTASVQSEFTQIAMVCIKQAMELSSTTTSNPNCPIFALAAASFVDKQFVQSGIVQYTASIYATKSDNTSIKSLYEADKSNLFSAAPKNELKKSAIFEPELYEVGMNALYTDSEDVFYNYYFWEIVPKEIAIQIGALFATVISLLVCSGSPFLTFIGLIQMVLSLPFGFVVYYFIFGYKSFPVLNINAAFIAFSIGADDIFVAIEMWKNARKELPPQYSTEEVAVVALPSIALATFVTSITTSAAFFGSALIKVPFVSMFVIFCGLVIAVNYVLSVLLVYPAICLYDSWFERNSKSRWLSLYSIKDGAANTKIEGNTEKETNTVVNSNKSSCSKEIVIKVIEEGNDEFNSTGALMTAKANHTAIEDEGKDAKEEASLSLMSTFDYILSLHCKLLHTFRYVLLILSLAAIVGFSLAAADLQPPEDIDPPIFSQNNKYERHRIWSGRLLLTSLFDQSSDGLVVWGSTPAEPSNVGKDPSVASHLVLDYSFEPSEETNQLYLLQMCDKLFEDNSTSFERTSANGCLMQEFNDWLMQEAEGLDYTTEAYINSCQGASSIPVPPDTFDSCLIAFHNISGSSTYMYEEDGTVRILAVPAKTETSFKTSLLSDQDREWNAVESWLDKERLNAPLGAHNFYFSSVNFWVYDTLFNMRTSARTSIGIATACVATMILLTSCSLTWSVFAVVSVLYVFVASIAMVSMLGWEFGVFESILFTALIGIGCDYVLHVTHAYKRAQEYLTSGVLRKEHTQHAILHIGKPILCSAFTTLSGAILLMFAENTYSKKFSTIIIVTIINSLLGSLVVFPAIYECIGCSSKKNKRVPELRKEEHEKTRRSYLGLEDIGNKVDQSLATFFSKIGHFCSYRPKTTISICIFVCSVCAMGMTQLNIESRSEELWVVPRSTGKSHEKRFLSYFPSTARFENLIVSTVNSDSNVLTKDRLLDVMAMHESIETGVSYFEGGNYTFTDLCLDGGGSCKNFDFNNPNQVCSCLVTSILKVWDYNRTKLEMDNDVLATINTYGVQADLESVLGEPTFDTTGTLVAAEALSLSYFLEDRSYTKNGEAVDPVNEEWESSVFLPSVQSAIEEDSNDLRFVYLSARSFKDEFGREIEGDIVYLNISYIAAFLFVGMTIGTRISCGRGSRWALSGSAIALVGMATVAGFGVASLTGLLYGPVHSVLPFLLLGIGVDDVFVIINAFDREREGIARASEDNDGIKQRGVRALKRAGASITVTSLTDIVAFAVSSSSALPALASFCAFASINILFLWSLAATFFTSCTVIDEKRQRDNRRDCLCCLTRNGEEKEDTGSKEGTISRYFRKYHAPAILSKPGKVMTIASFAVFFAFGFLGAMDLPVEDSQRKFIPTDSYMNDYFHDADEYFPGSALALYITFEGGEDIYNSREELAALDERFEELTSNMPPYITSPSSDSTYQNVMATLKEYMALNEEALKAVGISLGNDGWPVDYEDFVTTLKYYTNYFGPGAKYAPDLSISSDGLDAYRVKLQYVTMTKNYRGEVIDDASQQIDAMDTTRQLVSSWGDELPSAFPYSTNFVRTEGLKVINTELYRNIGLTIVVVGFIVTVTVANITVAMLITLNVAFAIIEILGCMFALGLVIDNVSVVNIVLAVGLSVDYSCHVGHCFMVKGGEDKDARATQSLADMGAAVFNGALSTFLAVVILFFSQSYVFRTLATQFALTVVIGAGHGLILLPVMLSLFGPKPFASAEPPLNKSSHSRSSLQSE